MLRCVVAPAKRLDDPMSEGPALGWSSQSIVNGELKLLLLLTGGTHVSDSSNYTTMERCKIARLFSAVLEKFIYIRRSRYRVTGGILCTRR